MSPRDRNGLVVCWWTVWQRQGVEIAGSSLLTTWLPLPMLVRGPDCRLLLMGSLDDEFLTVAEVAELLKLNQQTLRNWI